MSRLTEKTLNGYSLKTMNALQIAIKLGKLEDIEEELGIDLITFFKLKKGTRVYTRNTFNDYVIESIVNGSFHICPFGTNSGFYTTINEYGETWALTKEELL